MSEVAIELLTFVVVFAGACAVLGAFVRDAPTPGKMLSFRRTLSLVRQYSPAVDVMMEYRDARAFRTLRRVRIIKMLRNRAGRLYLLGFYEATIRPRTFRMDRVICFASLDGEVFDTRRFMQERLDLSVEP